MTAATQQPLPVVLVPGLLCTPRLYADQLPALWRFGPVIVADHTRDASISAIAQRILAQVQGPFALIGLSMGGYVAFEILRHASERVTKVALLDTTARPDAPEQSEARQRQIDIARSGTRREEMLMDPEEHRRVCLLRRVLNEMNSPDAMDLLATRLRKTASNAEFLLSIKD